MKKIIIQKLLGLLITVVSIVPLFIFKGELDITGSVFCMLLGLFFVFTKENYLG